MAFVVKDRTKESTSTTGTGSLTLSGAASNYQTFNTAVGVGNFTWYCINHLSANEWEVGYGQLTASTTFARTTVIASTNSNALVSFSAGTKEVFVTQPAAFNNQTLGRTNMIINPHGSIQQETTTPVTVGAGNYFADQWYAAKVSSTGVLQAGVISGGVSLFDLQNIYIKTTTAQGALAAGDYANVETPLEGFQIRRLQYGGSTAKGSWLRFRASCTQSATCSVSIRNASSARSFVQTFAVTTTPTDFAIFVPGDTTGTWPTDANLGVRVGFTHSCGTTLQTSTLGAWQAGGFIAANTQTSLMATLNAQLNVTDVQWSASDVLLPFEPIEYAQELRKCQRYLVSYPSATFVGFGMAYSTNGAYLDIRTPTAMRASPTISVNGTAQVLTGGSAINFSSVSNTYYNPSYGVAIQATTATAGLTVGDGVAFYTSGAQVLANARM